MNLYVFCYNQNKINEKIEMIYFGDNTVNYEEIGNIYNFVDYINNIHVINAEILFVNFTDNQFNYVISKITLTKSIDGICSYNKILISDRKRKIRGKFYDKMD